MDLTNANAVLFQKLSDAQMKNNPETEAASLQSMKLLQRMISGKQHSTRPLHERILNRVVFGATECWHWVGLNNGKGYGRMSYQGRPQVAHRLSWQAWHGDIPKGMSVLHKCDNRACVNPEHLWLGTYSDNMKDCWKKGRNPGRRGKK